MPAFLLVLLLAAASFAAVVADHLGQHHLSADRRAGRDIWHGPGLTFNSIPSPVHAGGTVYLTSGFQGNVILGASFTALAVNTLDDGFDASPAIVGDEIYLRGRKALYRFSR